MLYCKIDLEHGFIHFSPLNFLSVTNETKEEKK